MQALQTLRARVSRAVSGWSAPRGRHRVPPGVAVIPPEVVAAMTDEERRGVVTVNEARLQAAERRQRTLARDTELLQKEAELYLR